MSLLYLNKIPDTEQAAFAAKLAGIAAELKADPNWLMQVMWAESKLKSAAVNPKTGASGLIQFMPATAKGLGTSVEALRKMNAVQQLDYVRKYFLPYKGRMKSYYDVYSVVFFPALIGKPDSWVLQTSRLSAEIIAKQNPVVNIIKDSKITVAEFKQYVFNSVEKLHRSTVFKTAAAGGAAIVGLLVFFCSSMISV